jgi:probable rRNA maturation factor
MPCFAHPLTVFRNSPSVRVPLTRLRRTARFLYRKENVPFVRRTVLVFCTNQAIRRLNRRYRRTDRATDVLSFAFGDDDLLGEIYISPCRAAVQARHYRLTYPEEILRLFIHGFYHLLGYDHTTKTGRIKMEEMENTAFNKPFAPWNRTVLRSPSS